MMLGAPYWSVILINAGFFLLALESLIGGWSRWVLLFPFLYFGGYVALTGASHYEYHKLQKEIAAHNDKVTIPFDTSENDLVVSSQIDTRIFLTTYGLNSVYVANPNFEPKSHLINIIGDQESCNVARGRGFYASSIRSYDKKNDKSLIARLGKVVPNVCLLKYPADPKKPIYSVRMVKEKVDFWLLPLRTNTVTIKAPDSKEYVIRGGFASPYTWLPKPIMGCGLNSGSASWDCFHGFSREKLQPLNKGSRRFLGDSNALAKALELEPVPEQKKYKPKNTSIDISKIAQNMQQDKENDAYKRFEELLLSPVAYSQSLDFEAILSDQKYLESHIVKIIGALDKLKSINTYKADKRRALSLALVSLPLEIIQRNSADLFNLFNTYEAREWIWHNKELFIRLGDLGPEAYPLLKKVLETNTSAKKRGNSQNIPVAYAICRAGKEIEPFVGTVLLEELKSVSTIHQYYREKRALYIALARIGLRNKADQILTVDDIGHYRNGDELISENSPASICVDASGKPTYPD